MSIMIENEKCVKCGVCSEICPYSLIEKASGEGTYPYIPDAKSNMCIKCGQCESFCPSSTLSVIFSAEETPKKIYQNPRISKEQIALYLKSRRSIRHFKDTLVEKETILSVLDTVRYAPSGMNLQPVKWIIVHEQDEMKKLLGLTMDWMKSLPQTNPAMASMFRSEKLIQAWENGADPILRKAPHLAIAYTHHQIPSNVDSIIAMSYLDAALPAFNLGGFWAGFFSLAAKHWEPLRKEIGIPDDHKFDYAYAFGHPTYEVHAIPQRKSLSITWK